MLQKILENEQVQIVLIGLISTFLAVVGKLIISGLNLSKVYFESKIESETGKFAIQRVFDKVSAFVTNSYKMASEDLKEKIKDGKLTAEEKAEWKKNVIEYIKVNSDKEVSLLKQLGYDVNDTIKFHAEMAFADVKKKLLVDSQANSIKSLLEKKKSI